MRQIVRTAVAIATATIVAQAFGPTTVVARAFRPAVSTTIVARAFRPAVSPTIVARAFRPVVSPTIVARAFRPAVSTTIVAQAFRPAVAVQSGVVDLAALEAALNAAPDDLKAGNDYRMAVIQAKAYDRAIAFFQKLVTANPSASNAHLNYGFAYVDKIPDAGAITQVILANNALGEFTKSIEIKPSWIALYTRGNSYLFWPRIFNRTHLGIDDLNEALKMQKAGPKQPYHVRVYVALGDGYWKIDDVAAATNTWREGLAQFPGNAQLQARLAKQGDDLKTLIEAGYDPAKRVDTSLQDLWAHP